MVGSMKMSFKYDFSMLLKWRPILLDFTYYDQMIDFHVQRILSWIIVLEDQGLHCFQQVVLQQCQVTPSAIALSRRFAVISRQT